MPSNSEIENNLSDLRRQRGLSAAALAKQVGVTRQTIYAMEAGSYIPNTAVALKLARALETTVEQLFTLPDSSGMRARTEAVTILPGTPALDAGQPVQLCRVDDKLVGSAPSPIPWYFPASDAVVADEGCVEVFQQNEDFTRRILVAGCDPGISVLSRHVQAAGVELVLAHRNSSQSLALLKEGCVHVAGTHLRDEHSGESNLPAVERLFPKDSVAVISFALWEEGIVTARGNPKEIHSIADFARPDVAIMNREAGAGIRVLLDERLKAAGIDSANVIGYNRTAPGHLPAAWQVRSGGADCCLATRAAARLFGLHFIPLISERYDLAVRTEHLDLPGVRVLLDTLGRSGFRRELEGLGGYDTRAAGARIL